MTIVKEIKWDVFDALENREKPTVFMHGCNMQGKMGSGVAKQVREKWPHVYRNYTTGIGPFPFELGDVMWDVAEDKPVSLYIANALTQEFYGYDPDETYASVDAIEQSIQQVSKKTEEWDGECDCVTVRVGCGLGGLDWWTEVRPLYEESDLDWTVYFLDQDEIQLTSHSTVFPHPNPAEVDHLKGKWVAKMDTGGMQSLSTATGKSPEEARRNLISNLKRKAGVLMKEANTILKSKMWETNDKNKE